MRIFLIPWTNTIQVVSPIRILAIVLLAYGISAAFGEVRVLGIDGQPAETLEYSVVATEPLALRILLPVNFAPAGIHAELYQLAGRIAQPLSCEVSANASPDDPRVGIVSLTPPAVERVTRLALRLRDLGAVNLIVYPAAKTRTDLQVLADALKASRLKLAVCGRSPELRAFLKSHALEFEDHGNDAPDSIAPECLLIGVLAVEDWARLSVLPAKGGLLAFVEDGSLLPGVYSQLKAIKVTLPLLTALPTDPRARETFHQLLLTALTPSPTP